MRTSGKLLFLAFAAVTSNLSAQTSVRPQIASNGTVSVSTLSAARLEGSIVLDGKLDEQAWQRAAVARDQFTQSWPNPGRPGTEATEVRVAFDANAVYVAVKAFDSEPDKIAAPLARRDIGGITSDWIHVIIDSYWDKRTGFRFTVNPRGVQKDVFHSNDNSEDANWDAVWDVATRIDKDGWVAEYRIPLSQLRFGDAPAGTERTWGFQVQRDIARKNERVTFHPWTPDGTGFVSRFGTLTGITDLRQPQRLEVLPYVSTKLTRAPGDASDPFYKKNDAEPNLGADIRYGLPKGLTLTATINPDFGQVEVDPATVNLSAFETFFPEKRPFFLEGADVFSFGRLRNHNDYGGQTFFYTRRIGRSPSRFPEGGTIAYVDQPAQTRIAGAAKISGRVGPWTVGILDAVTAEEEARVASASGLIDSSTVVEPLTNFFAGRMRRDFRSGQSSLGGMITTMNRQQSDLFRNSLSSAAGFGGIDFDHRWNKSKYSLTGFAMGSRVNASSAVITALQRAPQHYYQRPDSRNLDIDATATSLQGHYVEAAFSRSGNSFGSIAVKDVSPGFEINDIGFHGRVDYRAVSPFWGLQSNEKKRFTRNYFIGGWSNYVWNHDGDMIYHGYGSNVNATFHNMWGWDFGGGFNPSFYDDRLLRGGPLAKRPSSFYVQTAFWSDNRKRFSFNPYVSYNKSQDDTWSTNGGLWMETRPATNIRLTFNPQYNKSHAEAQYVRQQSDADASAAPTYNVRYLFSDLDQTTFVFETRIEYTFTSKLSLQSYIQPFIAVGRYTEFKEFTTPSEYDFAVYGRDRGTITPGTNASGQPNYTVDPDGAGSAASFAFRNPNFNDHSLRGNAVLRWEYRPGSALYFVWQQERFGSERDFTFDANRDVGAIFRERPTNVFMIKAAYWLSK